MKVDTDVSKKSAASIIKIDPDIPDTPYNNEKKLQIYIRESCRAAEVRAALIGKTCCDNPRSTSLFVYVK